MPESMKKNYPNHAATFDCFEVATEIPSKVAHSVLAYSHYKSGFTIKVLGATSAAGVFMFMSEGWFSFGRFDYNGAYKSHDLLKSSPLID